MRAAAGFHADQARRQYRNEAHQLQAREPSAHDHLPLRIKALRRKRPWRHTTAVHREKRRPATARNDIWSMDFVADQLADGRRFRSLTIIDLFTRECLAIEVGHTLGGHDVAATLERLRFERGVPQRIYCDNGTSS